ncbi:MAG: hypothetical protein KC613_21295 [Myxococcales bacterium]|nr:hypothetical protein [Myxococcales bacterium]MCB9523521.1 hypothetical protein [Myxococcales bacterium]
MGLFGKIFGGGGEPKPPRWARAFETKARFDDFIEWLQSDLERRGIPQLSKTLRMGAMTVRMPKRDVTVSFFKVADRLAATEDPEARRREVDDLLMARLGRSTLHEAADEPAMPEDRPAPTAPPADAEGPGWAKAKGLLKTQFFSTEYVEGMNLDRSAMVTADFAPGLVAVLMYDHGGFEHTVPKAHLAAWKGHVEDAEDAIAYGLAHVRETEAVQVQTVEAMPGVEGQLIVGNGFFVSAWAAEHEPEEGEAWPHGVLLAFPSRHGALFHPLKDKSAAGAYGWMASIARQLHQEYPDPLSPKVYWRRDEDWVELPYVFQAAQDEGGQPRIELQPPRDFIKLLRDLGADLGDG